MQILRACRARLRHRGDGTINDHSAGRIVWRDRNLPGALHLSLYFCRRSGRNPLCNCSGIFLPGSGQPLSCNQSGHSKLCEHAGISGYQYPFVRCERYLGSLSCRRQLQPIVFLQQPGEYGYSNCEIFISLICSLCPQQQDPHDQYLCNGHFAVTAAETIKSRFSVRIYSGSSGIISSTSTIVDFPFCIAGLNCHCRSASSTNFACSNCGGKTTASCSKRPSVSIKP